MFLVSSQILGGASNHVGYVAYVTHFCEFWSHILEAGHKDIKIVEIF
jgi:hypothetical protein